MRIFTILPGLLYIGLILGAVLDADRTIIAICLIGSITCLMAAMYLEDKKMRP